MGLIGSAISGIVKAPYKIGAAAIVTGGKVAYGAGKTVVSDIMPRVGQAVGAGVSSAAPAIGKGAIDLSVDIGKVITSPFNTRTKREAAAKAVGTRINKLANNMVSKNDKGDYTLSFAGTALVGTAMTYSKLNESFAESKGEGMGTVDKYVTRPTPDYRPKEYEMHPPKRISYDSGGATGDLVFALNRLRQG